MTEIATITLWQPWASLIFTRDKRHETRSFAPPARLIGQRIAIHAAKRSLPALPVGLSMLCSQNWGPDFEAHLPRGAVLGTVLLVAGHATDGLAARAPLNILDRMCGDWSPGRFAWELADPEPLREPLPYLGKQGWFRIDRAAIADTHPKDGDVKQAPLVSGGGAQSAIAQPSSSQSLSNGDDNG